MEFEVVVKRMLLAWALAFLPGLALAQSPAVLADDISERAADAMFWGDWDELERLYTAARKDMRRAREGGLAVCQMASGLERSYGQESLAYHEARVAGTLEWARFRRDLPLAHAVHLRALVDLAWFHRGNTKVATAQRFAEFNARLNDALTYSKANAAVLSRDPFYANPQLVLMRGMGFDVDRQLEVVRKNLRNDPTDECLYRSALAGLLPKAGGEPRQLEAWVRESMRGQADAVASARYARLYSEATASEYDQGLFENTQARWPLMRDGVRAIIKESPDSKYWKNRLAYFACMAKDRDVAVPALEAVEAAPDVEAWGGSRNLQACKRWVQQG